MNGHRDRRAATLVELLTTVAIVAVLGSVATARVASQRERAAAAAVLADIDAIFTAAELYRAEHGDWPPNVERGETSPVFDAVMRASPVGRETPIGGDYDWNGPGTGADSYGVYLFDGDPGSFALIDELGDDGSLATGSIVFESPRLHFKLEPAP